MQWLSNKVSPEGVEPLSTQGPLYLVLQVGVKKDDTESKGLGSNSDHLSL